MRKLLIPLLLVLLAYAAWPVVSAWQLGRPVKARDVQAIESMVVWVILRTNIKQTLTATGARTELGLELYQVYLAAGLPGPSMRMDALIGGGPDCLAYDLVADVVSSLLPVMEKLKIATAAEVDISSLAQRLRDEVVATKGVVLSPALIGSWSRKIM